LAQELRPVPVHAAKLGASHWCGEFYTYCDRFLPKAVIMAVRCCDRILRDLFDSDCDGSFPGAASRAQAGASLDQQLFIGEFAPR
jgi:hypothetical protein